MVGTSLASRQMVPVPVPVELLTSRASASGSGSGSAGAAPACPIGYGAHASAAYASHASLPPYGYQPLPIHDASLDGIDQEYVLISTRTLAATLPPATAALAPAPGGSGGGGGEAWPGEASPSDAAALHA